MRGPLIPSFALDNYQLGVCPHVSIPLPNLHARSFPSPFLETQNGHLFGFFGSFVYCPLLFGPPCMGCGSTNVFCLKGLFFCSCLWKTISHVFPYVCILDPQVFSLYPCRGHKQIFSSLPLVPCMCSVFTSNECLQSCNGHPMFFLIYLGV